jgi:hypothetical protein
VRADFKSLNQGRLDEDEDEAERRDRRLFNAGSADGPSLMRSRQRVGNLDRESLEMLTSAGQRLGLHSFRRAYLHAKNIHGPLVTSNLAMHRRFIPSFSSNGRASISGTRKKFVTAKVFNFFVRRILTSKSFRPPDLEGISC